MIGYSPRVSEQPPRQPPHHPEKGSHCATCGAPYGLPGEPLSDWPRRCPSCGDKAYRNPLPVAVALLPVLPGPDAPEGGTRASSKDGTRAGLVVVTRSIEPALGTLALPGGFIDHREDWRHAVVRELAEETGIQAPAHEVRLADALSSPDGHLLLFGLLPPRPAATLPPPAPTDETDGWHLLHTPRALGFPLHTTAVRNWFEGRYARVPH